MVRDLEAWNSIHARESKAGKRGHAAAFVLINETLSFILFLHCFLFAFLAKRAFARVSALGFGGGLANVVSIVEAHRVAWSRACPEARYSVVGA